MDKLSVPLVLYARNGKQMQGHIFISSYERKEPYDLFHIAQLLVCRALCLAATQGDMGNQTIVGLAVLNALCVRMCTAPDLKLLNLALAPNKKQNSQSAGGDDTHACLSPHSIGSASESAFTSLANSLTGCDMVPMPDYQNPVAS